MAQSNVDKQVCRLPNVYNNLLLYHTVTKFTAHQFLTMWNWCWYKNADCSFSITLSTLLISCAIPLISSLHFFIPCSLLSSSAFVLLSCIFWLISFTTFSSSKFSTSRSLLYFSVAFSLYSCMYLILSYRLHKLVTHLLNIQFCLFYVVQLHTTLEVPNPGFMRCI